MHRVLVTKREENMRERRDKLLQVAMINHLLNLQQRLKSAVWPQRAHNQPAESHTSSSTPPPYPHPSQPPTHLQSSKASATRETHMYTSSTGTHTKACLRATFHTLPASSAAVPTPGHLFPPCSFQQPVLSLPAVTRLPLSRSEICTLRFPPPTTNLWREGCVLYYASIQP